MRRYGLIALLLAVLGTSLAHAQPVIKPGARVAIAGDSITEQKIYCRFIEDYLLACQPQLATSSMQFGWSGEWARGFLARMDNDMHGFAPTVVTLCYGMNDGSYTTYTPAIGQVYQDAMRQIVDKLKAAGVTVIVGSPGAVDSTSFHYGVGNPTIYNDNLRQLGDLAKQVAAADGMPFADLHNLMMTVQAQAKAAYGPNYLIYGNDGVHPNPSGHLVMAYAFLKAMGFDGNLGTITVDLQGQTTATGGDQVLSSQHGVVQLLSVRYPFCFYGAPTDAGGTRSVLPYLPFNQDLNRLTLVVKNLGADQGKVTWGTVSKTFPRASLEAGINLAAEFPDNPFSAAFQAVDNAVAAKENWETTMIKQEISPFPGIPQAAGKDPLIAADMTALGGAMYKYQGHLLRAARNQVVPIKHTLTITPVAAG